MEDSGSRKRLWPHAIALEVRRWKISGKLSPSWEAGAKNWWDRKEIL
jgi:hypothetical protein